LQTCPKCGAEADDFATVCPNCGAQLESIPATQDAPTENPEDSPQDEDTESSLPPEDKKPPAKKPPPKATAPPVYDITKRPTVALIAIILLVIGGALMIFFATPYLVGATEGGVTLTANATTTLTTITSYTTTFTSTNTSLTSIVTTVTNSSLPTATSTYTSITTYSASVLSVVGIPYVGMGIASIVAAYLFFRRINLGWRLALVVGVFSIIQTFILISDPFNLLIGAVLLYLQTRPQVRAWLKGPVFEEPAAEKKK